ncbi:16S rRNA (cytosine(1402)-N(4))-methyltransferase RsmH [Patescibacteria group bacterium]|nr:16S rRNA (cytosine(1402)-N(4))-methyltransferase RsmH [Patescibacteria group bacterium]
METKTHTSVLLNEAVDVLDVKAGDVVVDGTLGGAGHFEVILNKLDASGTLVGIDADNEAIERAQEAAKGYTPTIHLVENNFRNLEAILDELHIEKASKILLDLGWSSFHLSRGRGFSFRADEPLLMTYGTPTEGRTAADMVNNASEEALADLFFSLGEERFSRGIAKAIVRMREESPITTTTRLVEAVMEGTPGWYQHRRIHPATKVFQALRIAVNDELGALRDVLEASLRRLEKGGRISVITFHSIEDRVVKEFFRDAMQRGEGIVLTKKPLVPSSEEVAQNPRARSAKLRVFEVGTHAPLKASFTRNVHTYA